MAHKHTQTSPGETRVKETDGACTRGLQNTSAKVLQLVKAAQCQVTTHHGASDRNGPVMSQAMNHGPQLCPSITAESKQQPAAVTVNVPPHKHSP